MGVVHTASCSIGSLLDSNSTLSTRAMLPQTLSTANEDLHFNGCQQAFKHNLGSGDHLVSGNQTSAPLDVQLPLVPQMTVSDGTCKTQNDGAYRVDDALNPVNMKTNHLLTASNVHNLHQYVTSNLTVQSNCHDGQISVEQVSQVSVSSDHVPHQHITPDLTKQSNYGDVQMSSGMPPTPHQMSAQQTVQASALTDHNPCKHITPDMSGQPDYCDNQMSTETSHCLLQTCAPQALQVSVSNDHHVCQHIASDLTKHHNCSEVQMSTEVPLVSNQMSAVQAGKMAILNECNHHQHITLNLAEQSMYSDVQMSTEEPHALYYTSMQQAVHEVYAPVPHAGGVTGEGHKLTTCLPPNCESQQVLEQ
ncbi:hypothetical protein EDC04DRAFT_2887325 [Pisolithus marmoratus]|nr:hypothetical protein EDC04DRAFT_2887325 [Pisolithus marmoratus]